MLEGEQNSPETEKTCYSKSGLEALPSLCLELFGPGPFEIITDDRIWKATKPQMADFLRVFPRTALHILPAAPQPYASDDLVAEVRRSIVESQATPLALGAGTINDVVKRASFELGRRYICVPTAPSVDGFAASGAAISVNGFKSTLPCPAPRLIVAAEDILVSAPADLIASGFGDLLAKLTGGADWIIADMLGVEGIDRPIWNMVQPAARSILGRGRDLRKSDRDAVALLYQGLVATGIGMQLYHDSRPASGSEHLISHVWEMDHLAREGVPVSHGFKVALGTLIIAAFMEELLAPEGKVARILRARDFAADGGLLGKRLSMASERLADNPIQGKTEEIIRRKTSSPIDTAARAKKAADRWEDLGAAIKLQLPPFGDLRAAFEAGACPVEPADIGLGREACMRGICVASLIRTRYTVLDLASELGVLEETAAAALSKPYFSRFA